ncbi:uncharacterized protein LOC126571183 [Anopheles aquasalis]|uniref:uncharacterized protein LOC126571183 n=1 Tax=Anopheles aquasalis TaxID=42839 RepID=UPI00215AEC83|nr:uncharacterized protein LOC126571183 [Anopheles aquasalis]
MKLITALVVVVVAVAAEAGYVDPYETGLAVAHHHDGAYYGDHYDAGYGSIGHHAASYPAHYLGAYHYDPSGTFSYWGSHGPTVVQQNAASLPHPVHGAHPYAPYSTPYGLYGAPGGATVVQANVATNHHWGYPAVYGAAYGHGYGYDKYLAAAPATKYLL